MDRGGLEVLGGLSRGGWGAVPGELELALV